MSSDPRAARRRRKTESDVEVAKRESRHLRGSLGATLASDATHFRSEDVQVLKFHGVYQQEDRDSLSERKSAGLPPEHSFMVRVAIPGGRVTAEQYLQLDALADACGNGTLRITTRQGIQYHRVLKDSLRTLIAAVNRRLLSTLAACGDVERNVMASPAPLADPAHRLVQQLARDIARELAPRSRAYHEIWLGGEKIESSQPEEPFYGAQYLPRKFKTAVSLATHNDVDVYAHDVGLIAVLAEGRLEGLQLVAGGGLGMTHNKPTTMATLAKPVGFIAPQHGVEAARVIASIFRDHGNRVDRKHARLKYLIHEWGIERFRQEFRRRASFELQPPRELPRPAYQDYLGRHAQGDDRYFYGVYVENGRIRDADAQRVRSALRRIVEHTGCGVTFTPSQNLLLRDLSGAQVAEVESILAAHGVRRLEQLSPARRYAMACPALPTCGLALTESERVMPAVIDAFEPLLEELGLEDEPLTLRMTGCPNGCARPYTADIGFVGRKPGQQYNIYVGGGLAGDRLADLYAEDVAIDALPQVVRPLLEHFAARRRPDESFSDFYLRLTGRTAPRETLTGKEEEMRGRIPLPTVG